MTTLPEMFQSAAHANAERAAIVSGDNALTYRELANRIAIQGSRLRARGVRPGDRIGLMLPNSPEFVIGYFAILSLGAIVVPLNEHYQQTELCSLIDECGVSVLIASPQAKPLCDTVLRLCQSACQLMLLEDRATEAFRADSDWQVDIHPNAPAMYQFSSGSTGQPKRIARTHANLVFELDHFIPTLGLNHADRFLGVAPFSHVNGLVRSMLGCLCAGGTLYPLPKFERNAVAEIIQKKRLTVFIGVPFMFSALAQTNFAQRPDFSSLRHCVSASAPLPEKFALLFHEKFGVYIRQLYGSTETGTISVNLQPNIASTLASVGTPLRGVTIKLVTAAGQIAPAGEVGEVAVASPAAISGYEGLDALNRDVFRDGYFLTGDLGKLDRDGLLYLVGRTSLLINKGGYKIDPYQVETVLEMHPSVQEAAVIGVPTPYGDEIVKAIVVLNAPCPEAELVEFCRGKIAAFKIPSRIEFRETLPKSSTGKILRKTLT